MDLTEKMLHLNMERKEKPSENLFTGICFLIRTEGAFVSIIRFEIESGLYEAIANSVYKKQSLSDKEKKLYVTEYLNIICGRILSQINNALGKRSKLSVPIRVETNEVSEVTGQTFKLSYVCACGSLNMIVYYDKTDKG